MNDILGKSLLPLAKKKLFLLDMDGTLYLDGTLFEGTLDFLSTITTQKKQVMYITNNSSKSVSAYIDKLNAMGIGATKNDFFTSSMAMTVYLKKHYPNKTVYCMGTTSLIEELVESGIKIENKATNDIDVVVLGYDTELTYQKLVDVSWLLQNKALPYLATNPDTTCPTDFGFVPDCGGMATMLEYVTGKLPQFIGKPNPLILLESLKRSGVDKRDTVVIGDRLYTDILSGINADIDTVCVLSGETTLIDIENSDIKPTYVVSSIKTICELLNKS